MEVKTSDGSIDLMTLLVKFLDYIWANLFLTVFLPVAGALVGWGFSHISENRSESQMMIVTEHLSEPQCEFLLEQLEKTDSFPDVNEDQRKGLISLTHRVIPEERIYPLYSEKPFPRKTHVEITLRVKHGHLRKVFENSIIRYLQTSQPAIRKKEELEEYYKVMVAQLDQELSALNDRKKHADDYNCNDNTSPYLKSIDIAERKVKYEQASRNVEAFQIVKGFDGMNKPKKASPTRYSLVGLSLGVGLLIFMLFLKYFVEYYRAYHQKHAA